MKKAKSKNDSGILYKYCSQEWHTLIDSNLKRFLFKKGDFIFRQGDKVEGIHIIVTGNVKVGILYPEHPERILRLAGPNKLLGHRGIANNYYPITATALTECEILFLPNNIFVSLLKTNPELSLYLINFLAEEIRDSEERLINLIQLEVKERMACVLIALAESFGFNQESPTKLAYTLSRTDFASFVGTTYETIIRTLFSLQKSKLIKLEGKEIHILNLNGLKKMLEKS